MSRQSVRHGLTFLMLVLMAFPSWTMSGGTGTIITEGNAILYTILLRVPLFALALTLNLIGDASVRRKRGWRSPTPVDVALMLGLPLATLGIGSLIAPSIRPWETDDSSLIIYLLVLASMSAVIEELVFRSWILSEYECSGRWTAAPALASAFLFASLHAWQGAAAVLFAFAVGIAYSAVFLRRRNLWTLMAAHGIHNALAILLRDVR